DSSPSFTRDWVERCCWRGCCSDGNLPVNSPGRFPGSSPLYKIERKNPMQAIVETLFDAIYLSTVLTLGILMIKNCGGRSQYRLFGLMAVLLGAGDAFHLVPRAVALCTTGLENYTVALGLGKWITSVTMTIFYLLLYHVWRQRYQVTGQQSLTA